MSTLVVYYSLSGTTRSVAMAIAEEFGADLEEIRCRRYVPGFWGYLRAGYDSWKGNLPPIERLSHTPSHYDLVIVGGPIWAAHAATPVRAFLRQKASGLPEAAFFLTHGGTGAKRPLHEMELLAEQAPRATLLVREADVKKKEFNSAVAAFASSLRQPKAA